MDFATMFEDIADVGHEVRDSTVYGRYGEQG
jgi:hypothetical protein